MPGSLDDNPPTDLSVLATPEASRLEFVRRLRERGIVNDLTSGEPDRPVTLPPPSPPELPTEESCRPDY